MKKNVLEMAYDGYSLDEINNQVSEVNVPYFTQPMENHLLVGQLPDTIKTDNKSLPFYVHPFIAEKNPKYRALVQNPSNNTIKAQPTSSGRTMWVENQEGDPWFLKLHFPLTLGRFPRELSLFKWLSALERSKEIMSFSLQFPKNLALLEDFGGTFFQGDQQELSFGTIFRKYKPFPYNENSCLLVPAFSLFANPENGRTQSILADFIQYLELSFSEFLNLFVVPIFESYCFLITEIGLIPEFNSQNVLFEFDLKSKGSRLVLRDHGDCFIDHEIRKSKGLHRVFCSYKNIGVDVSSDFFKRRSFSFDFKLSHYLLNPILEEYCILTGYSYDDAVHTVKNMFNDIFDNSENYFESQNKWYSYPKELNVSRSSYIENKNPLFR